MTALDERVSTRYRVSLRTTRIWIFWRWKLLTGRIVGDGAVVA